MSANNRSDSEDEPLSKRFCPKGKKFRRFSVAESDSSSTSKEQKPKWDRFCWQCHRKCDNGQLHCSKCIISYHKNCMNDVKNRGKINWKCPECKSTSDSKEDGLGEYALNVIERVILDCGEISLPEVYQNCQLLLYPVTFAEICAKAKKKEYPDSHTCLLDFKWLKHNCNIIVLKKNKGDSVNEKKEIVKARDHSKEWCLKSKEQFERLSECIDCFMKVSESRNFVIACRKPHLVLWVKYGIYPYWPAKFRKIEMKNGKEGPNPIEVHFFDANHESASVAYSDCYLYSKEDPNTYLTDQFKNVVKKSMEEAEAYIKNVEAKFGPFRYAPLKTRPIEGQIERHLDEMIPGYRDPKYRPKPIKNEPIDQSSVGATAESQLDEAMHEEFTTDQPNPDPPQNPLDEPNNNEVKLPSDFYDRLKLCRDYCALLTEQNDSRALEIEKLRKEMDDLKSQKNSEIETLKKSEEKLKKEVAELKGKCENHDKEINECKLKEWCHVCLSSIDNENTINLCEDCTEVF